jgi:UDP-2-acetamido-2,6-beta-L-arabino-hexul-4-ose reductase
MSGLTVGVTGPGGFVAGHLAQRLRREEGVRVELFPREVWSDPESLAELVGRCDTLVHLAGMNRGPDDEVLRVNVSLARQLAKALHATSDPPHVIFASSTQRDQDNAYGRSKLKCEEIFRDWSAASGGPLSTMVIPNVYGAGCKPFYNSVVATFCHQLARGQRPEILVDRPVEFLGVTELVTCILEETESPPRGLRLRRVDGTVRMKVSELRDLLDSFRRDYFEREVVPDLADPVRASLYATFLSYVELDQHRHRPQLRSDPRGSLYEVIKLANGGQVFFSTTRPGVIRGNHYHTRKVEWFCVVRGEAVIRMRRIGSWDVREFRVSGDAPEFISIPVFCTHSIENVGEEELLTMFWCNEIFDADDPDTHFEKVA